MAKSANLIAIVVLLAGCASSIGPNERTEWRQRVASIQILEPDELQGRQYEVLGEVVGRACIQSQIGSTGQRLDELGTPQAAKRDSRLAAERLGASAVTNFVCVSESYPPPQGVGNCTKRYRCEGEAIRFRQ